MAMEALGRLINVVPTAGGNEVSLEGAEAVTYVCNGDEAYTVQEAMDADGTGAQNLVVVDRYYQGPPDGSTAWVLEEQEASATVDPDDATDTTVVFCVHAASLSDGFTHVVVTAAGTGTVTAVTHDLNQQRSADNLPALGV